MKQAISTGWAACAAAAWMAVGAVAQSEGTAPVAAEPWSRGLCEVVEEGVRLLDESRMAPDGSKTRAAVLEALILAAEPSAEFLDEEQLAARSQRMSEREWDAGLTLVATDGLPKVASVREGSPAEAAGIVAGELVEKVGGRDILSGANLKLVREMLAEGDESGLEIVVRAADAKSRAVALERVRRAETSLTEVEDLPAEMGYMKAAGIFPGAGGEIVAALAKWKEAAVCGAILDLRGAGGTAQDEIPHVAAHFEPVAEDLYTTSNRQGGEKQSCRVTPATQMEIPLMVLVDEETTGAAELLAAVLAGSAKGVMIIGRETSGDPMIREPVKLSTGRHALLATRQVAMADGTVYAGGGGVEPDVAITDAALNETVYEPEAPVLRKGKTISEEEKEDKALRDRIRNDTYLRRATDVLLGLQALGFAGKS